jgi:long-subunit acyl-CoA synthetase (AMP-forming)
LQLPSRGETESIDLQPSQPAGRGEIAARGNGTGQHAAGDHEKIARLCIVGEPWSIGNGIMTPAMKFRRHVVEQRYAD